MLALNEDVLEGMAAWVVSMNCSPFTRYRGPSLSLKVETRPLETVI